VDLHLVGLWNTHGVHRVVGHPSLLGDRMTFEEWWAEHFSDNLQLEFKAHMKSAWEAGYAACMDGWLKK
jgi:hypothetical protein